MRLILCMLLATCLCNACATTDIKKEFAKNAYDEVIWHDNITIDENLKRISDILFDIAVKDRDAYHMIMKLLFAGNCLEAGFTVAESDLEFVDYAIRIALRGNGEGHPVKFLAFYQGAYKSDYSDVKKTNLGRKAIYPAEAWEAIKQIAREGMPEKEKVVYTKCRTMERNAEKIGSIAVTGMKERPTSNNGDAAYHDKIEIDETSRELYDIIIDIATRDRWAYHAIMDYYISDKNFGASATAGEKEPGFVDYAINVSLREKSRGHPIKFEAFYQGSYRTDYSDVKKTESGRKPLYAREAWEAMKREAVNGIASGKEQGTQSPRGPLPRVSLHDWPSPGRRD